MDIFQASEEMRRIGIVEAGLDEVKRLAGGTSSVVGTVGKSGHPEYVIKINEPSTLRVETEYLRAYQGLKLVPKLRYVDPDYRFIVYRFVHGSTDYVRGTKMDLLRTLIIDQINHYTPVEIDGRGWLDELSATWGHFLLGRIEGAKEILEGILSDADYDMVVDLVHGMEIGMDFECDGDIGIDAFARDVENEGHGQAYLLHGDCGVHNFIMREGQLAGVIDPTPVVGKPIYDLVYAFVSSPDGLTFENIKGLMQYFRFGPLGDEEIVREAVVGLYLRIGTCVLYHNHDLPLYREAWDYWKGLL